MEIKNFEQKEKLQTLEELLGEFKQEGFKIMPIDGIKQDLNEGHPTPLIEDFLCGLRISRQFHEDLSKEGYKYIVLTTNGLEDPEHPIAKKFRDRKISID